VWLYRLNHALGPVIGAYFRLGITGEVGSIPRTGAFLVVPNHSSFLDPWIGRNGVPRLIRWLIAREWYERSRTAHFLFRAFGTVPGPAGRPAGTVDAVCAALDRGDGVGVFPEGGVSADGRIRRFRGGIARMAARSGAPVIPVGVRGRTRASRSTAGSRGSGASPSSSGADAVPGLSDRGRGRRGRAGHVPGVSPRRGRAH